MKPRALIIALLSLLSFFSAYLWGKGWNHSTPSQQDIKTSNNLPLRFGRQGSELSASYDPLGLAKFITKLNGKLTLDDLEELWGEYIDRPVTMAEQSDQARAKKLLIMKKWGEIAPIQGAEKYRSMPPRAVSLYPLFEGWASKDPESAIAYFERVNKEAPDKFPTYLAKTIAEEYAKHSLPNAQKWLLSKKEQLGEEDFTSTMTLMSVNATKANPETIPDVIQQLDGTISQSGYSAYELGEAWGEHNEVSKDWIEGLSDKDRVAVEIGWIKGVAKNDSNKFKNLIDSVAPEYRDQVLQEIAPSILYMHGSDMPKRVEWVMDVLPKDQYEERLSETIKEWLLEDRKAAKSWIDSLPAGEKQETLLEWYNDIPEAPSTLPISFD